MIGRVGDNRLSGWTMQERTAPRARPRFGLARAQVRDPSPTAPSAAARAGRLVQSLETQRTKIDALVRRAMGGEQFSPAQLLAMQATVYRYSEQLDAVSKLAERAIGALKTTLNTQV